MCCTFVFVWLEFHIHLLLVSSGIFFIISVIAVATPYSLASCLISFSCVHTSFPFTSPRFVMHYSRCNTLSVRTLNCRPLQRLFRDVAQAPARIMDIILSRVTCAGSHLLSWNRHSLATKKVKKAVKVKKFRTIHTLRSLPGQGAMCAMFGSDWFRNVNLYKVQTNKFSALYIR